MDGELTLALREHIIRVLLMNINGRIYIQIHCCIIEKIFKKIKKKERKETGEATL